MARIEGVDLPRDKRVVIGLTYIYGIGKSTSQRLLERAGINQSTRVRDLSESEVQRLRELIGGLTTEGDLRRQTQMNIKRLMEINSYRGLRHRRRLRDHLDLRYQPRIHLHQRRLSFLKRGPFGALANQRLRDEGCVGS